MIKEARAKLKEAGILTSSMRIRSLPFTGNVNQFIREHKKMYIVEMNRDGQLRSLLSLEYPDQALKLKSIAYTDGLPMTARYVLNAILAEEAK